MSSELLAIIESQQETIATLTKLLEMELAKVKYRLPDPPNWDTMKYADMLRPTCGETTGKGISEGTTNKGGVGVPPTRDRPPPPKPPECRLIKNGKWINKGEYK